MLQFGIRIHSFRLGLKAYLLFVFALHPIQLLHTSKTLVRMAPKKKRRERIVTVRTRTIRLTETAMNPGYASSGLKVLVHIRKAARYFVPLVLDTLTIERIQQNLVASRAGMHLHKLLFIQESMCWTHPTIPTFCIKHTYHWNPFTIGIREGCRIMNNGPDCLFSFAFLTPGL
jgi:hypothetical protein